MVLDTIATEQTRSGLKWTSASHNTFRM